MAFIVYSFIMQKATPVQILQSITSGLIGRSSYEGGTATALSGLLLQYVISFSWTIGYFLVFPYIPFLKKQQVVSGLLYGVVVWLGMNFRADLLLSKKTLINYIAK